MKLFNIIDTSFSQFDNTIKDYLTKALGNVGLQYSNTQLYNIIFKGIKGVMQNAMFYIEDAFTEQNINTAYRKSSVYSLAKISGYEPYYGSAATGTLLIKYKLTTAPSIGLTKIYIKNYSIIQNSNTGVNYTIYLPGDYHVIDLSSPLTTHQIKIVQGVMVSATYVGVGKVLETIHISTNSLYDKDYLSVYVNGVKWSQESNLYDMADDTEGYFVSCGYDNTFDITFGNGVHGKMLNQGDSVIVRYIEHIGSSGNILKSDNVKFKFLSSCYDVYGNEITVDNYLILSLDSQISGGTDADSIDIVKNMIGYESRSTVIASEDNFRLFLKRFSFIGQSNIWSEPNSLSVTISCLGNYKDKLTSNSDYLDLTEKDMLLTDNQKSMIIETFNNSNKTFAGINILFKDPIIRKYGIICYVKVDSSYNKEAAKDSIKESIADYLIELPGNTSFIPKSDIIKKVIDENDYIKSFDITFISEASEAAYKNGYYYKYELKYINGSQQYVPVKYMYEKNNNIGLDSYGNIQLNSNMEIPLVHGGFKYYPDKDKQYKAGETEDITIDTLQFFFI